MCGCTSGTPPPPAVAPAAGVPVAPGVLDCGPGHSGIALMDELGRPMANLNVQVTMGGVTAAHATDGRGMIVFAVPAGAVVAITIADTQGGQAGESTNDASGQHFRLLGTGP